MWGRAVVEGLFGIQPQRPEQRVVLCPQFPLDWPAASIETPHFGYTWRRLPAGESLDWRASEATSVRLRLPLRAARVDQVRVDGQAATSVVEPGVGLTWLTVETPVATSGSIVVHYQPIQVTAPPVHSPRSVMWDIRHRIVSLTTIAAMAGCPQISLPLCKVDGLPVGLSLIGPRGSDAMLLAAAERIGKA